MILIFGCLRRVLTLVLLAIIAYAIWTYRQPIVAAWHRFGPAPAPVESPAEAARSADAKLQALESPRPPARTAFSQAELQALLRTRFASILPDWVDSTRVGLEGDRMRLSGRVPSDRLPKVSELGDAAGLLPDTAEVSVKGQVIPLGQGRVALAVDQITAAHIPVPRRLISGIMRSLRQPGQALPGDALLLPLPHTISSAYVRDDSLIVLGAVGAQPLPR
jgi:hypothetical protein